MSHGVHAVQHEVEHKIKHDEHGGHGADSKDLNKRVALLIAVLALFLAFKFGVTEHTIYWFFGYTGVIAVVTRAGAPTCTLAKSCS